MPGMPLPLPASASTAGVVAPVSETWTTSSRSPYSRRTPTSEPGAYRAALVSDSCTIRYAARSTCGGSGREPTRLSDTRSPERSISSSSRSSPAVGERGAPSRSTFSTERISPSTSLEAVLIVASAVLACSGLASMRWSAVEACTWISEMLCASTSCSSWAMVRRSSLACRLASSSAIRSCSMRRSRTILTSSPTTISSMIAVSTHTLWKRSGRPTSQA